MIHCEKEYKATLERISHFQKQIEQLRKVETNQENYHLSVSGLLAEFDRMNQEVREYLWSHPGQYSDDRRTA